MVEAILFSLIGWFHIHLFYLSKVLDMSREKSVTREKVPSAFDYSQRILQFQSRHRESFTWPYDAHANLQIRRSIRDLTIQASRLTTMLWCNSIIFMWKDARLEPKRLSEKDKFWPVRMIGLIGRGKSCTRIRNVRIIGLNWVGGGGGGGGASDWEGRGWICIKSKS